jgi:Helicase conserved C-terminal domain
MLMNEDGEFQYKFSCVTIDSGGTVKEKTLRLQRFTEDPDCNICLLTTGTAATGLTLTVSHICYMMEPIHNAAEEAQALNRVHRIGQTERVRCVIFYAKDTAEERLLALRNESGLLTSAIANNVTDSYEGLEDTGAADSDGKKKAPSAASKKVVDFIPSSHLSILFGCSPDRSARLAEEAQSSGYTNGSGMRSGYTFSSGIRRPHPFNVNSLLFGAGAPRIVDDRGNPVYLERGRAILNIDDIQVIDDDGSDLFRGGNFCSAGRTASEPIELL